MKTNTDKTADAFGEVADAMRAPLPSRITLVASIRGVAREVKTNEHGLRWLTLAAMAMAMAMGCGAAFADVFNDLLSTLLSQ